MVLVLCLCCANKVKNYVFQFHSVVPSVVVAHTLEFSQPVLYVLRWTSGESERISHSNRYETIGIRGSILEWHGDVAASQLQSACWYWFCTLHLHQRNGEYGLARNSGKDVQACQEEFFSATRPTTNARHPHPAPSPLSSCSPCCTNQHGNTITNVSTAIFSCAKACRNWFNRKLKSHSTAYGLHRHNCV